MKKLNKKGVSLAELLAVVVIMGIIAAIAIPLVGNVIETSKKKAFLGDLITITEAARTYCITEDKSNVVGSICTKGTITDAASDGVEDSAGGIQYDSSIDVHFSKYLSKPLNTIGDNTTPGNASVIHILTDGNKYMISVTNTDAGDYVTNTAEQTAGSIGTSSLIDPTHENAIDRIQKIKANA